MGNINKNFFSSKSEPHRAKLCFFVLMHFWEIHRELLFLVKKVAILEWRTEILRKFVFLNNFE